jgi:hypothetical protein
MNFEAILFDCDGVLVDSEAITCGVLRDMFDEQGWRMTLAECMQRFVGHTVKSQRSVIEAHTGVPLTDAWLEQFYALRNERLTQDITAIEGVHEAVAHLHDHCQGRIAVASGADRFKVEMMLKQVGLMDFFEGRIFSGHEMPRSKPHPDVYWSLKTPRWASRRGWLLGRPCGLMRHPALTLMPCARPVRRRCLSTCGGCGWGDGRARQGSGGMAQAFSVPFTSTKERQGLHAVARQTA